MVNLVIAARGAEGKSFVGIIFLDFVYDRVMRLEARPVCTVHCALIKIYIQNIFQKLKIRLYYFTSPDSFILQIIYLIFQSEILEISLDIGFVAVPFSSSTLRTMLLYFTQLLTAWLCVIFHRQI